MRLIDRSRRVDAICAAGSWKRFSIRDSVNCQSREQNEKINHSMDPLIFWPISQAFQPKNVSKPKKNHEKSSKTIKKHEKTIENVHFS